MKCNKETIGRSIEIVEVKAFKISTGEIIIGKKTALESQARVDFIEYCHNNPFLFEDDNEEKHEVDGDFIHEWIVENKKSVLELLNPEKIKIISSVKSDDK